MKGNFLTARWNNILSIVLGLIALLFFIFVLTGIIGACGSADAASFIALIAIGGTTWALGEAHSAVRFARTNWRIKRHTHPITIIGHILAGGVLAIIILTFNGTMGYTTGFIALAVIIFLKVGLNILRNAVLK